MQKISVMNEMFSKKLDQYYGISLLSVTPAWL